MEMIELTIVQHLLFKSLTTIKWDGLMFTPSVIYPRAVILYVSVWTDRVECPDVRRMFLSVMLDCIDATGCSRGERERGATRT